MGGGTGYEPVRGGTGYEPVRGGMSGARLELENAASEPKQTSQSCVDGRLLGHDGMMRQPDASTAGHRFSAASETNLTRRP